MQQPIIEQEKYKNLLVDVFPLPKKKESSSSEASANTPKVKAIRIRKADGTYNLRLHVENNGVLEPPLEFPTDKLRTKILEISNYSVPFNGVEIHNIILGIHDKMAELNTLNAFDKIGWHTDSSNNIVYWQSATGMTIQGNPLTKDIYAPYPSYNGDLDANITFINNYISKHGAVAQSILLYGFSAVLVGFLHFQPEKKRKTNLLLSLSGKSSRGKTTIAKLLVSLFAEPENEKLSTTFNVTLNRMAERLGGIYGSAVLIDDLSLAPSAVKKNIDEMLFVLENGKEKERMKTKSFDREPSRWATSIILSAEKPLLGFCDTEQEGAVGRLMELNIGKDDLFSDANEANQIADLSHKHYGLMADEFVKRLISNGILDNLNTLYKQEVSCIGNGYSDVMSRTAENVAVVTLCGKLLNQLFSFQFKVDDVTNYLMSAAKDNLENFRISQKGNVIMATIYDELINYAKESCPDENKNLTDHVVISSKATKAILAKIQEKLGYKPIEIKKALKEGGVLFANDGPYSYTGTINKKSFRGIYLYTKDRKDNEETPDNE